MQAWRGLPPFVGSCRSLGPAKLISDMPLVPAVTKERRHLRPADTH